MEWAELYRLYGFYQNELQQNILGFWLPRCEDREYGGFFNGYETRSYTIVGEKVLLDLRHSFRQKPFDFPVYEPVTKEEFLEGLAELHIGEWKKNYVNPSILDGTQWSIDIEYEGDRKPVHIYGSNAFPYNFDDLLEFLGVDNQDDIDDDGDEG